VFEVVVDRDKLLDLGQAHPDFGRGEREAAAEEFREGPLGAPNRSP